MVVLLLAVLLLIVAPALLLWTARRIDQVIGESRLRAAAPRSEKRPLTGEEWFARPMRPAFTWTDPARRDDATP